MSDDVFGMLAAIRELVSAIEPDATKDAAQMRRDTAQTRSDILRRIDRLQIALQSRSEIAKRAIRIAINTREDVRGTEQMATTLNRSVQSLHRRLNELEQAQEPH